MCVLVWLCKIIAMQKQIMLKNIRLHFCPLNISKFVHLEKCKLFIFLRLILPLTLAIGAKRHTLLL